MTAMNTKRYFISFLVAAFAFVQNARSQTTDSVFFWDDTYGTVDNTFFFEKVKDGIIFAGSENNGAPGIVKIDRDGEVIWSTLNTFPYDYIGNYIPEFEIFPDGYLYASSYNGSSNGRRYILKVDTTSGILTMAKRFYADGMTPLRFQNYDSTTLIVAYEYQDKACIALLEKSTGDTLRTRTYASLSNFGRYYVRSFVDHNGNVYLVHNSSVTKFNGNDFDQVLWERSYADESEPIDVIHRLYTDKYDNLFLLGRNGGTFGHGDGVVARLDPQTGEVEWETIAMYGDISVADIKEYKDSLYIIYRHTLVGSTFSRFFTSKVNKNSGDVIWMKTPVMTPVGAPQSHSGTQMAGLSLDMDCDGDAYITGYYGDANYGPEQWGTMKLNGISGDKIYDLTITNFPSTFDDLSSGKFVAVFEDTARLIGQLEVSNKLAVNTIAKINPADGQLISSIGLENGIQRPSTTLKIQKNGDTILVLKQIGEELALESYVGEKKIWERFFDEEFIVEGGRLAVSGSYVFLSSMTLHTGASPPQPFELVVHKLNRVTGATLDSATVPLGSWGYKPMEVVASSDTAFVFYRSSSKVFCARWSGGDIDTTIELNANVLNIPGEVDINLAVNKGGIIFFASDKGVSTINKNSMKDTTVIRYTAIIPYQFIDINDTFYLAGRFLGRSAVIAIDGNLQDTIWSARFETGKITQIVEGPRNDIYVAGVDVFDLTTRLITRDSGNVRWTYRLAAQNTSSSYLTYEIQASRDKTYLGVAGAINNQDGTSDAMFLVLNARGDSIGMLVEQDEIGQKSYTRTFSIVSDTSVWIGGALNRMPGYFQGFLYKLSYDSLWSKVSVQDLVQDKRILVYPNPTTEELFVNGIEGNFRFAIYDNSGRKVGEGFGSENQPIHVSGLKPGVYHLVVAHGYTLYNARFIKSE